MPKFPFRRSVGQNLDRLAATERVRSQTRTLGNSSITRGEGSLDLINASGVTIGRLGESPDGSSFGYLVPDGDGWRTLQADSQARVNVVGDRVTTAEQRLGTAESNLNAANSAISSLQTTVANLQATNAGSRLTNLETTVANLQATNAGSRLTNLETTVSNLQNTNAGPRLTNLETAVSNLQAVGAGSRLNSLETSRTTMQTQINNLQSKLDALWNHVVSFHGPPPSAG